MNKVYKLVGLPEGLVGSPTAVATSVAELFEKYPVLKSVRSKLTIEGDRVVGFSACDG